MNFVNNNANIKQFQLIKFLNENCNDDHVISKISIVLRRDKIEAPFYVVSKIRLSTCIDGEDNGLIHAMDILNHTRMHNLTEEKYGEIRSLVLDSCDNNQENDLVKLIRDENQLKVDIMTKNDEEFLDLFYKFQELFDKLDNMVD